MHFISLTIFNMFKETWLVITSKAMIEYASNHKVVVGGIRCSVGIYAFIDQLFDMCKVCKQLSNDT